MLTHTKHIQNQKTHLKGLASLESFVFDKCARAKAFHLATEHAAQFIPNNTASFSDNNDGLHFNLDMLRTNHRQIRSSAWLSPMSIKKFAWFPQSIQKFHTKTDIKNV